MGTGTKKNYRFSDHSNSQTVKAKSLYTSVIFFKLHRHSELRMFEDKSEYKKYNLEIIRKNKKKLSRK